MPYSALPSEFYSEAVSVLVLMVVLKQLVDRCILLLWN